MGVSATAEHDGELSSPAVNWGPPTMKARALVNGASFGPDALKAIGQAFDEA
jgi:hypothetical protein